ncbi:TPA: aminotransferase class I/II-fold pyridoxal phosphate-dependent enzyme [Candidatus Woesearchaeota archaeon]|nr:aminotransferase class I/II-fold pyridoxal phosphate-dependent enzyme [Candidatus Woesearchaeota archaeon]HIH12167.1 aminotransferase class I/II-fold pyridoxal phosphate-dependent enzyme [Candidatus Woesearchaeota archaeon]
MAKDIKLVQPKIHDFELFVQRARSAFDTGYLTNNGPFTQQLEKEITHFLGTPSLTVVNGTLGLELVLRGLNLKGKVIVPSFTYVATAHAIALAGLEPLFVDIDPETLTLDPEKVAAAITPDTCAIVAVHVFGNPCAIDQLIEIAHQHHLPLLFDAAHAFGSLYKGKRIGQFGTAEIFSTHACKTLISAEGGLVSTFNTALFSYVQRARNFGFMNSEETEFVGTNAKMSELHAIVGLDSFACIRQSVAKQQEIASWYFRYLKNIPGLRFQKIEAGAESNYFNFSIIIDQNEFGIDRNKLSEILTAAGVQSRKYFYRPIHQHQAYQKYSLFSLPHTESIASNILCLPMHTGLTIDDVEYISTIIQKSCHRKSSVSTTQPSLLVPKSNSLWANHLSNHTIRRVLVTGGAGYVGCVLVKKLLEKGFQVRVLDKLIFGKEPLSDFSVNPYFDLQIGAVEDKYTVEKCLQGVDAVIHLAGLSNDPSCEINQDLTRKENVEATRIIINLAKASGVRRFIYASSCSVYGFTEGAVVTEESQINPLTAYAKSKIDCEKIILPEARDDLVVAVLRKATIYGPSPRMRFDLVINTMTGTARGENRITINGGEQWRPFLHVEDAADAYIFMLESEAKKINGQVFNVGSNEQNVKIADLAYNVAKLIPTAKVEQSLSPDNRSYRVNFDKINALGWKATKTIDEGILGVAEMFNDGRVKDFRDLNYFNIKRMITYLNV